MASAPANAQVHIGVGIGGQCACRRPSGCSRFLLRAGFYPPGPCDAYNNYYEGDCGYAVYNGPIVLGGMSVGGPHYYRWYNGVPLFWYRGGWQAWNGWTARISPGTMAKALAGVAAIGTAAGECRLAWRTGGLPWRSRPPRFP